MINKKINKKGFTLIELLVAMTILSIITAMAIPLLKGLTEGSMNKKYETYKDSLMYASKLYVDSYSEDLFDNRESGCAYIDIESLIDRKLIGDIEIDDVSCNDAETYIQVVKAGDKYTFTPFIKCGSKKTDGTIENNGFTYPEGDHVKDLNACSFEANFNMHITPSIGQSEYSAKKFEINLEINSYTGINPNVDMVYAFSTNNSEQGVFTNWEKLSVKTPNAVNQRKKIYNGSPVSATTGSMYTPDNADGNIYLVVKINNLTDLYGESWTRTGDKYEIYGPYRVDNSAPTINSLSIYKEMGKWYVDANISDTTNYEGYYALCNNKGIRKCDKKSEYTIRLTEDRNITSFIEESSDTYNKWVDFCANATDYSGNFSEKKCNSTTAYRIRYYANDGTNKYQTNDLVYNSPSDKKTNEDILTVRPDARDGYTFKGWAQNKNGTTPIRGDLPFTGAYEKLYAIWEEEKVDISLLNTDPVTGDGYHVQVPANKRYCLPVPEKVGYKFLGWKSRAWNGAPQSGENACITPKTTDFYHTYTAYWEEVGTVDLSLLNTDPVTGDGYHVIVTAEENYCLPTPKKAGYTFQGWTSRAWNTPHKGNDACFTPKTTDFYNTYTAKWKKN